MKLYRIAIATFERTLSFLAILAALLLIFMTLGISTEVTIRMLGGSIKWMMEVVESSLLFITFIGAAWVLKSEGHVIMDVLLTRLKPRTRGLLNTITSIMCAIVCIVVTWYGIEATLISIQRGSVLGTVLEPPLSIFLAVIPFGCLLLFIQFLRRTYSFLEKWRVSRNQEKGA